MVCVVGVRFKPVGKVYYFDPVDLPVAVGQRVIVETARGMEYGEVSIGPRLVDEDQVVPPLKRVVRIGTDADAQRVVGNKRKEKEAFAAALERIEARGLEMNLVDVEYTFDGSKIIFYFTAEGRIDFRELVKDLAAHFRTRIEMRQIGVRDEAKLIGGIGPCGRILCCSSFLGEFAPVSIRMAKDQNLSLNPTKISGVCGRLMCCLRYEQDTYEAAKKDPTLRPGYVPPVVDGPPEDDLGTLEDEPGGGGRNAAVRPPDKYSGRVAKAIAAEAARKEWDGPDLPRPSVPAPAGGQPRADEQPGGHKKKRRRGRGGKGGTAADTAAGSPPRPAGQPQPPRQDAAPPPGSGQRQPQGGQPQQPGQRAHKPGSRPDDRQGRRDERGGPQRDGRQGGGQPQGQRHGQQSGPQRPGGQQGQPQGQAGAGGHGAPGAQGPSGGGQRRRHRGPRPGGGGPRPEGGGPRPPGGGPDRPGSPPGGN